MPAISVLIKPSSGMCNLQCDYCFYCDETEKRLQASYGFMSEETLKNVIRKTILRAEGMISYVFQGGEPTLRGLDFYKKVIEYEHQYNRHHIQVNNALQTNGYLLNDEWCQFLKDNITNQEVTILNAMNFKRNDVSQDTMIKLPLPLFAKKLKELKKVKQDFSCIVDTSNALIYHLNKYIESINALNNETRTVDKVCSNMSKGKLLDSSDIKSSNIKRIIDSFNEFLCNKDNINTENNTEHYQQVKDELKEKKERIIELEKEIQELKEQNNKYKDENCSINDLLLCFDDVRNKVIELLKKPKIK